MAKAETDELRDAKKRIRFLEQENEVLAESSGVSVAGLPAPRQLLKMISPLVRELAAKTAPVRVPVAVTCGC
ncbi:hypothetical protein [Protaetiibacter intestinalis]|uniref:hypothetical protein n=1 Tax=Protaetiibacter intestinalis TaxID=2419774 RepID=UPI0013006035|nr:hypothetical protein [Protaetiibacter intestinalis]